MKPRLWREKAYKGKGRRIVEKKTTSPPEKEVEVEVEEKSPRLELIRVDSDNTSCIITLSVTGRADNAPPHISYVDKGRLFDVPVGDGGLVSPRVLKNNSGRTVTLFLPEKPETRIEVSIPPRPKDPQETTGPEEAGQSSIAESFARGRKLARSLLQSSSRE